MSCLGAATERAKRVAEVKRLLLQGELPAVAIARATGMSRNAVDYYAGRLGAFPPLARPFINWKLADWRRCNACVAKMTGATVGSVVNARSKFGEPRGSTARWCGDDCVNDPVVRERGEI